MMPSIEPLCDWLMDGAPGATTPVEVLEQLAERLRAAGVPVDRAHVFVNTLHPLIVGRSFLWQPGQPVRVGELTLAVRQESKHVGSPVVNAITHKIRLRRVLREGTTAADHYVLHELAAEGFTDYLCLPLLFTSGEGQASTFATTHPAGFSAEHIAALERVARPFTRIVEILALRRTAANLLDTYVGRNSGERILAGRIFKGDIETISAVIWFSDLRGFTVMSERSSPRQIIDTLNELFDCQVPAIDKHGGEVLKFIGDGLLAIFPLPGGVPQPAVAEAALAAAADVFAALARRNAATAQQIQIGLALHVGEIAYGNIGGASRLDFTAIGSAVNRAARMEGMTGKLGRPIVVSAEFAALCGRPLEALGSFELRGIAGEQRLFAPLPKPR